MNRPIAEEHPGPIIRCFGLDSSAIDTTVRLTSVGPENDIVCVWVVSTLEEVEKYMLRLDIDISRVRPSSIGGFSSENRRCRYF